MSAIFGALNISDTDRVFQATTGQQIIWDTAQEYINRVNTELMASMGILVDSTTDIHKERYKLPGGGYLQQRNSEGRYAAVKAAGQWDVAYPLNDYGAQVSGNDVDMAYMTVQELDRHIQTVVAQNTNTVRMLLLEALLNNTEDTFLDPLWGSLLIEPLANGDATLYPPIIGAGVEATANMYLHSGYAVASISDTNNPFLTIRNQLEQYFGVTEGGSNIVVFSNTDVTPYAKKLTDYSRVFDPFVTPAITISIPNELTQPHPGVLQGRVSGVWHVEWRYVPAGYLIAIQLGIPKPIKRRIDPADTGLGDGLQLVAKSDLNNNFPFTGSFWRHRFGFGVGNRLNGCVMQLTTNSTYAVPSGY